MSNRIVYLSMIATALFWAGAFVAGKMAVFVFQPLTLTFLRFSLALPFIFSLLWLRERKKMAPSKQQIVPLIILGTIGTLGYHFFFFLSLQSTTAINSSLIGSTNPIITTLLAVIFFKERLHPQRAVGIGISLLGVFCVITGLDPKIIGGLVFNIGDLWMLLGVLCMSTYAVLSRSFMQKYHFTPLLVTAYTFLVCAVLSFILSIIIENPFEMFSQAAPKVWLEIAYMAILASVVGYYFQLNAINRIGASQAAMFINLVPVFTIILAATILNETISIVKLGSALLIIGGVYLASKPYKADKVERKQF